MERATTEKAQKKPRAAKGVVAAAAVATPTKEVAVRAAAAPVSKQASQQMVEDWGIQKMTTRDIVIPKILAMQAMSKNVVDGKAKFGDFVDSLNSGLIGSIEKPFEIVPFYMEKVYVVMQEKNRKFEFLRQIPVTTENDGHEFECFDAESGKIPQKWYRTLQFYCLIPSEVKDGTAIPYLIAFRSSSARAGQKLNTTMYMRNLKAGKTPASMVMKISGTKTTNDKGTFVTMDVAESRESTEQEVKECFEWVKTIRAGATKVDHSDLAGEATGEGSNLSEPTGDAQY